MLTAMVVTSHWLEQTEIVGIWQSMAISCFFVFALYDTYVVVSRFLSKADGR